MPNRPQTPPLSVRFSSLRGWPCRQVEEAVRSRVDETSPSFRQPGAQAAHSCDQTSVRLARPPRNHGYPRMAPSRWALYLARPPAARIMPGFRRCLGRPVPCAKKSISFVGCVPYHRAGKRQVGCQWGFVCSNSRTRRATCFEGDPPLPAPVFGSARSLIRQHHRVAHHSPVTLGLKNNAHHGCCLSLAGPASAVFRRRVTISPPPRRL